MPPARGADGGATGSARLAEVVAALSLAVDLGTGQPLQQGLRTCLLATALGEELGCDPAELAQIHSVALLRHVGCTAENDLFAEVLGDEIAMRAAAAPADYTSPPAMAPVMLGHLWRTRPPPAAALATARTVLRGRAMMAAGAAVCEAGQLLAGRLGLDPAVAAALGQVQGRWRGPALPGQPTGEALALPVRIVHVAEAAEIWSGIGGVDAAVHVVAQRAGSAYDPQVAGAFCARAGDLLRRLPDDAWDDVLAAGPGADDRLSDDDLDAALSAMAEFTDLKSRWTVGHSSGVAALAADAATRAGLPAADVRTVRRAGLVHDVGRVGISAGTWGRQGPLSPAEWERVRLHPYHLERALARSSALAPLARLASLHHERLDGSGYHRGASAGMLPVPARILAGADVLHALVEPRPHRPPVEAGAAVRLLRDETRAGRLDPEAVEAVVEAAGRRPRRRPAGVAGLTAREVEVLRHVARGRSMRDIARRLSVAPKTVDAHIQHVYAKIGVSTRAGATLFAMAHGLLDALDEHEHRELSR